MKALYTLVFACLSFQALACDLDALNAATTVDYYAEVAAAMPQAAASVEERTTMISSEDTLFASELDDILIGQAWTTETTASISETVSIRPSEYDLNQTTVDAPYAY